MNFKSMSFTWKSSKQCTFSLVTHINSSLLRITFPFIFALYWYRRAYGQAFVVSCLNRCLLLHFTILFMKLSLFTCILSENSTPYNFEMRVFFNHDGGALFLELSEHQIMCTRSIFFQVSLLHRSFKELLAR